MYISNIIYTFVFVKVKQLKVTIMRKFQFLKEKEYMAFELPNGKMVNVYACKYDCKVDLKNETFILSKDEEEYELSNLPKMEELVKQGIVKVVSCIENTFDIDNIYQDRFRVSSISEKKVQSLINKFKKNGFNVTREAIFHNFFCWLDDMKSGYRDEKNNYHLFSPCGCNPFSLRATTLHPKCADWQTTYEW